MKNSRKIFSLILCICMLVQILSSMAFANTTDTYVHKLTEPLTYPIRGGSTVRYESVNTSIIDMDERFSLLYISDYYDGEGWPERTPSTILFKNKITGNSWNVEQSSYPLKCIEEDKWEYGKITKDGRYDIEFVVPKGIEPGAYSVTIYLYPSEGKEVDKRVKPTEFVIINMHILDSISGGGASSGISEKNKLTFNVADTTTLEPISGAQITIFDESGDINKKIVSDSKGVATLYLRNGTYNVHIMASGYQVRNFTIEKTAEQKEFSPYLNKNPLVEVETSVKEMTKQEMIDAGINVNATENKHIYKCVTVLKFVPVIGGGDVNINPIEINFDYVCDEAGTIIKANPKRQDGMVIHPVAKDIYLIIHSEVTWIKEIFDVQLVVANTSAVEKIKDCEVTFNLPDGLSLATMTDEQQSAVVEIAEIAPLATNDIHWYVCGDEKGEYIIGGDITGFREGGGITEPLTASFTMQEPITVLAGEAMRLLIEAERYATSGMPYKVAYTLQNTSDKTLYDVQLNAIGGKFREEYSIEELIHNGALVDLDGLTGTFNNGYELKAEEFAPGDILSGVFEITFGQGIETDYINYMVSEMFKITSPGSTTTIPTEITLVGVVCNHEFDEGVISTPPTEAEEGIKTYTCGICGDTMETKVPKLEKQKLYFAAGDTMNLTYTRLGEQAYCKATNDSENGGNITYTSSNDEVATIDESGKITILKTGETTIKATASATDKYAETVASIILIIKSNALISGADGSELGINIQENGDELEYIIPDNAIGGILAAIPVTGEAIIDTTGTGNLVNNLVLPSNLIYNFDLSADVKTFTIVTEATEITMDKDVLKTISEKMNTEDKVRINLEIISASELNAEQQATLAGISEDAKILQVNLDIIHLDDDGNVSSTESIHELGGEVEVLIPYSIPADMTNKRLVVYHISPEGPKSYIPTDYENGFIYFVTTHFSHYAMAVVDCEHKWGSSTVITPATTTSTGLKRLTCDYCGATKDEIIPIITDNRGGGGGGGGGGYVATLIVKFNTNGGSEIENSKVKRNEGLIKPDDPTKDGYTFAGWYIDADFTEEYDFSQKVTKNFELYAKWEETSTGKVFKDIEDSAWYKYAVKFVSEKGLMNGISETEFAPDQTLTRAMFVTVLYRLENEPEVTGGTFKDISLGSWYENAVKWATQKGIVNGVSETEFAPDSSITREQMSAII